MLSKQRAWRYHEGQAPAAAVRSPRFSPSGNAAPVRSHVQYQPGSGLAAPERNAEVQTGTRRGIGGLKLFALSLGRLRLNAAPVDQNGLESDRRQNARQ